MEVATSEAPEYCVPIVVGSLIIGIFFGGVGGGVAFPTLPLLGAILGISPFVVGVILSVNRFTRLLVNAPAGQVIDSFGARKPMIAGFILQGFAPFGYIAGLYPESIPVIGPAEIFILARVLWGVGSAFVFVGAFSTVVYITTEQNRGKWIGYFRGGQSLGFPTGLLLGGVLTDIHSYEFAFGLAGVLGLFAAVVAAAMLPEFQVSAQEPAQLRELPRIVRSDDRLFAIATVNFTVRFLFAGILLSTIVLYADTMGIRIGKLSAAGMSGIIMAVSVLCASGTTFVSGTASDFVSNRAYIILPPLAALAFGFGLLSAVPTLAATILGVACIGIGVGGTNPPLLAYIGDIIPEKDVGKMGGFYNIAGDFGSALGPVISLPLAEHIGYRAEYFACSGLVLMVSILVIRTLIQGKRWASVTVSN